MCAALLLAPGLAAAQAHFLAARINRGVVVPPSEAALRLSSDDLVEREDPSKAWKPCSAANCGAGVIGAQFYPQDGTPRISVLALLVLKTNKTSGSSSVKLRWAVGPCGTEVSQSGRSMDGDLSADPSQTVTMSGIVTVQRNECVVVTANDKAGQGFTTDPGGQVTLLLTETARPRTPVCGFVTDTMGFLETPCQGSADGGRILADALYYSGVVNNCEAPGSVSLTLPWMTGPREAWAGASLTVINCSGKPFTLVPANGWRFSNTDKAGDPIESSSKGDSAVLLWMTDDEITVLSDGFVDLTP